MTLTFNSAKLAITLLLSAAALIVSGCGSSSDSSSSSSSSSSNSSSSSSSNSSSSGNSASLNEVELLIGSMEEGLYSVTYNVSEQSFSSVNKLASIEAPSYSAITPDGSHIFALSHTEESSLTTFQRTSQGLINKGTVPAFGTSAAHLAFRWNGINGSLGIANFWTGEVMMYVVNDNDSLPVNGIPALGSQKPSPQIFKHESVPQVSRIHWVGWSPNVNAVFYAVDYGANQILAYAYEARFGGIDSETVALKLNNGDNPRQMAFSPKGAYAYILNETSGTVVVAKANNGNWDGDGSLTEVSRVSTLPSGFKGKNQAAHIQLSANGKFLYASNRGHNSIAVFSVDPSDNSLTLLQHIDTGGDWPRNFLLLDDANLLMVANQNSNNLIPFAVGKDGKLTRLNGIASITEPVYIGFLPPLSE